jgi:MFS family permease
VSGIAGMPLSTAIFAGSNQVAGLLLFALLFGVSNGLVTIVRGTLIPQTFGHAQLGRISGAMSAIALLARAAAPLLTAGLLLVVAGYRELLLALVGAQAVGRAAFSQRSCIESPQNCTRKHHVRMSSRSKSACGPRNTPRSMDGAARRSMESNSRPRS